MPRTPKKSALKEALYTILDNRKHMGTQSLFVTQINQSNTGRKYRVSVRRDFYDYQSHARVDVWTKIDSSREGWAFVYSIPYPEMASMQTSYSARVTDYNLLVQDTEALMEMALKIVEDA